MTQQTYEDGSTVTYEYDNSGHLAKTTNSATNGWNKYYYDLTYRLVKTSYEHDDWTHSVEYIYNEKNNLSVLREGFMGYTRETDYYYDSENRLIRMYVYGDNTRYTYDDYGRLSTRVSTGHSPNVTETYTYRTTDTGTTNQVAELKFTSDIFALTYSYTYDSNGNIISVSDGTNTTNYSYDSANQLIREDNQAGGFTHVWTYDNAGNILSRAEYAYTTASNPGTATDTITYAYDDSEWGDLLTSYDGNTITYDEIGNPLSDGKRTYTWKHGRELATITQDGTTWTNTYDTDGIRLKRSSDSDTYQYTYTGDKLAQLCVSGSILRFTYDVSGKPLTAVWNGTPYYYVTNLQGDVVGILDREGNSVVSYSYDAWGNLTSEEPEASTLGSLNPLRYRGYVYDSETNLYYCQSRYYDPEMGRFINADAFTSTGQGLLGNNMFAYCLNNPVNFTDKTGNMAIELTALSAFAVTAVIVVGSIIVTHCVVKVVTLTYDLISRNLHSPFEAHETSATIVEYAPHTKNNSERTRNKHEEADARRQRDQGGEKKKQKSGWKSRSGKHRRHKDDLQY